MPKKALILRAIDGMSIDESYELLKFADLIRPGQTAPESASFDVNFLHILIKYSMEPGITGTELNQIKYQINQLILKQEGVRDYLSKLIYDNLGSRIVFYNDLAITPILKELNKIQQDEEFDLIAIGGGHGLMNTQMSGLKATQVTQITGVLRQKNISASAIVLGSCYSASFANQLKPFLKDEGVMISDSTACAGQNHFLEVLNYVKHSTSDHFLDDHSEGLEVYARIARTEVLGVTFTTAQFEGLKNDLVALGNGALTSAQINTLKRDHTFITAGIEKQKEQYYLKNQLRPHAAELARFIATIDSVTKAEINSGLAVNDFSSLEANLIGHFALIPQGMMFVNIVVAAVRVYGIGSLAEISASISPALLANVLEMRMAGDFIEDEATLTAEIMASLRTLARNAAGEVATGIVITTPTGHTASRLHLVSTGAPAGTHEDDIRTNNLIIRDLTSTPGHHTVTSDLSVINSNTQRTLFNDTFRMAMAISTIDQTEEDEDEDEEVEEAPVPVEVTTGTLPVTGLARSLVASSPLFTADPQAQQTTQLTTERELIAPPTTTTQSVESSAEQPTVKVTS